MTQFLTSYLPKSAVLAAVILAMLGQHAVLAKAQTVASDKGMQKSTLSMTGGSCSEWRQQFKCGRCS